MTNLSDIKLKEKHLELNEKVNVCPSCFKFLIMQGAGKNSFLARLDPSDLSEIVKCDICHENEAQFVISPFERGIQICEHCLKERRKKHNWTKFKIVKNDEDLKCDLCLSKGAKLLKKPEKED